MNGTFIFVIKDELDRIEHISITEGDKRADIVPVHPSNISQSDEQPLFASISEADYDDEKIDTMTKNHKEAFKSFSESSNDGAVAKIDNIDVKSLQKSSNHCLTFKVIEVAMAYDATLCQTFGYNKQQTDRHIQAIVGLASLFYEPMCVKLKISHIDGYCDISRDPYYKMVRSEKILEEFTASWRSDKGSIQRGAAHLLTGSNFEKGVLGKSLQYSMCGYIFSLSQSEQLIYNDSTELQCVYKDTLSNLLCVQRMMHSAPIT